MLLAQISKKFREPPPCPPRHPSPQSPPKAYDVVVVGAGFAGMYMLHRLRGQGMYGAGL